MAKGNTIIDGPPIVPFLTFVLRASSRSAVEQDRRFQYKDQLVGPPQWPPNALSYLLAIFGDDYSAVVYSVNTPKLFGAELRTLSAVTIPKGTITRFVDYWNRHQNPLKAGAAPDSDYPTNLGLKGGQDLDMAVYNATAWKLGSALGNADIGAAARMFSYDATLTDLTLNLRQHGQLAIAAYLRTILQMPWGSGSMIRNVLGESKGGGYEWRTGGISAVRNGIVSLAYNAEGNVTSMMVMWDGSRLDTTSLVDFLGQSIAH